jgi:hypothetical protein
MIHDAITLRMLGYQQFASVTMVYYTLCEKNVVSSRTQVEW